MSQAPCIRIESYRSFLIASLAVWDMTGSGSCFWWVWVLFHIGIAPLPAIFVSPAIGTRYVPGSGTARPRVRAVLRALAQGEGVALWFAGYTGL